MAEQARYFKRDVTGSIFKVEQGVYKWVDGKWVRASEQATADIMSGDTQYDEIDAPKGA